MGAPLGARNEARITRFGPTGRSSEKLQQGFSWRPRGGVGEVLRPSYKPRADRYQPRYRRHVAQTCETQRARSRPPRLAVRVWGGVVDHSSVEGDSQAPSPEGDARSETCPWGRSAMKRAASTAAAAPRWTWVCASCAAANLPFHEGPAKCAAHDPGRNHHRHLRREQERIAQRRERFLHKEAERKAKYRCVDQRSLVSEASGPTVTTKTKDGTRPINHYLCAQTGRAKQNIEEERRGDSRDRDG